MGIAILLGGFLLLIVLGVPIAISLTMASVSAALYLGIPLPAVAQRMVNGVNKVALLAVPFFLFAGQLMAAGGISQRLVDFSRVFVGRMRGGLAMVNVLASMFFGGMSGSSVADTSSIGAMLIPVMKQDGYKAEYATSVTISSSIQGIIIPPSHNMIIYALAAGTNISVGMMFLGGLIPGILLGVMMMLFCYIYALKQGHPRGERLGARKSFFIIRESLSGLLTPVIIVGGVITGIFTATESAAIACVWAFLISFFIYREIPLKEMIVILKRTLKTLIVVLPVIAAASAFGFLIAYLRVPRMVTASLLGISSNKYVVLMILNLILLGLGCIMDMAPLILICAPIMLPVAVGIGIHPVHFGIIMIMNLAIGLLTPPVGVTLFVGSTVGNVPIEKLAKANMPFYLLTIGVLLLVTYFPPLVMWLPMLVMQ